MIDGYDLYTGNNMFHENGRMQLTNSKSFTSVLHAILKDHFGRNSEAVPQFDYIKDRYQEYIPQLYAIIQNTIKCLF